MAREHSRKEMVRHLTDHEFPSEHWLGTSQLPRKTNKNPSVCTKEVERNVLGLWAMCNVREEVGQVT